MAKKRTPMNKIKEVLRLKYDCGLSNRSIASCLKLGPSTISELLTRFKQSQLGWPLPESCSDTDITQALYHGKKASRDKVMPDFTQYAVELRRKGMTKMLLWQEYHEQYQEQAYAYTQFCEHFTRWLKTQKRSMRQHHVAGDKLFIDYCGPKLQVVNPDTGEVREAEVFVATLGASNYTYVEAFPSQGKSYWLEAHANAFEHFGGVPQLLVPDNLRSAVTNPNRYEPRLNDSYQKLANHYQTAVMPARPYKPKDKAKAENAVLLVERWIMMRLRHQTFHTFKELNLAIRELMNDLNEREMKQYSASRKALFDKLDKPALKPLPKQRYLYTETKRAKVGLTITSNIAVTTTRFPINLLATMSNWKPPTVWCKSTIKVTWSANTHAAKESVETVLNQSICRITINIRSGRLDAYSTGEPISAQPHEKSLIRCSAPNLIQSSLIVPALDCSI